MKAIFILNPIIIAVSLNRGDAKERVVVGEKSQVYSRLNGNAESRVLYDEVRNIGEFIFEHEKQLNKDWNAEVIFPLREALACPVGRAKNESAAWQYLEEKEKCGDSITIFTAACCRRWYEENKTLLGSRRYAKRFEGRIMGLTRSFKQLIVEEEKECTIEKIMDGMRQSTSVYTTDSEMSTTFQYPARRCEGKYLIIDHTFLPAIWYYMDCLQDWGFQLCKCERCGKMFFSKNMRFRLCSEACKNAQKRQSKQAHNAAFKGNPRESCYTNITQQMRERKNKVCKNKNVSEEQKKLLKDTFDAYRKEACQLKKQVETLDDTAFKSHMIKIDCKYRELCEEVAKGVGVETI